MINTDILSRTAWKLPHFLNFRHCVFEGLGATYTVHLRLIGKLVAHLLYVFVLNFHVVGDVSANHLCTDR